jgi:lactate permease
MPWLQNSDPLGNPILSTAAAALPVCTLFYFLAARRTPAWRAAVYAFLVAVAVALAVFRMPISMAAGAVADGLSFAFLRVVWVVIAAVFIYDVSVETGQFEFLKQSIASLSADRRIQALLIAFAFGALLEGAGGGGAPVAVTGAMMIGLGFPARQTALLCLLANSSPVAFGTLGTPVRTLTGVTGLPGPDFSAMLGRILPFTTLLLPFWLVRMMKGWRETFAIWPPLAVAGVVCAGIQFFWSNYIDGSLVDIVGGVATLVALVFFLRIWMRGPVSSLTPHTTLPYGRGSVGGSGSAGTPSLTAGQVFRGWLPFALLAGSVALWGIPVIAHALDSVSWRPPVPGLHLQVVRTPPVVAKAFAEPAIFDICWLSTPGTGMLVAGFLSALLAGMHPRRALAIYFRTAWKLRLSLVAILAMLGIGYLTRYCGMDATLGMAFAHTGVLFPFFGTFIGWIGVALSGTDAGSNALFGSLQAITANHLGLSPILMGAANSAGGVMGKMVAAQSLVIGCAVTNQPGEEGPIFRAILKHSLALLSIVGIIVTIYAYVFPGAIAHGVRYP